MKDFYKYFGIVAIMLFSFYYTEKIALMMRKKDPIYETINVFAEDSNTKSINATIKNNTIIPGINGLTVNIDKSFQKMKSFGAFNKYYLIFEQIKPEISLEDNKDKIITKGNSKKKSVALILEETGEISEYLKKIEVNASILITTESFQRDSFLEQINNDSKKEKEVDSLLDSIKQNKKICIINNYNENQCRKNNKYLVKPSLELTNYNIASIKGKIESGDIILIKKGVTLNDVKILLQQIYYKGLEPTNLSSLILEENKSF